MTGRIIKELRKSKKISQEQLAKILNVSTSAVGQYETGIRKPSYRVLNTAADYFGVSVDFLLGRNGIPSMDMIIRIPDSYLIKLPIVSAIISGKPLFSLENIEGYESVCKETLEIGYDYFFVRIKDDSMSLIMRKGSLALIQRQPTLSNDDIAIVLINEHLTVIRKYFQIDKTVVLMPASVNADYQPEIYNSSKHKIRIVGKVVKVISSF